MADTFTCDHCGGTFEKGLTDEEAEAEVQEVWGGPIDDPALVCDDCWEMVRPDRVPKDPALLGAWGRSRQSWDQESGRRLPDPVTE